MSTLIEIKSEEEWKNHSSSLSPTALQIIYFFADWAAPCKNMTTVLQTLASSYPVAEPLSTSWVSVNAEEVMEVSDAFDVSAVPYLVLTRAGEVVETVSGSDATKVRTAIERHAKAPTPAIASNGASIATTNGTEAKNLSSSTPAPQHPVTAPEFSLEEETKESKEELHKRLEGLVKAAPVMLFMKGIPSQPQCGFSRQLVALLRENQVKYGYFNILADDDVRQGLKEFADWPTFPQLWVDGELVGGLDIVKEEISNDPDFLKAYSVAKAPTTTAQERAPDTVTI